MQVESISNGNLRVWLTDEEMEAWGITEDGGHGVRRLVRRALTRAGQRPSARMLAEMIPVVGGCVVLVSPMVHNPSRPTVYFIEVEHLSEVVARWHPLWSETAQVYAVEEGYHLVTCGEQADGLLREYGCPVGYGEGVAAHTAEYGVWQFTVPAPVPPAYEDRDR